MVREPEVWKFVEDHAEDIMKKHMGLEGPFEVIPEYSLPNGQSVDRVIMGTNKKVLALFECKGDVGTNEFVGGVGQAIQGAYHIKKNLRGNFAENARSFLVIPIGLSRRIPLDLFDMPNITLLLVDLSHGTSVEYKEGSYISSNVLEWVTINPYYFRDCSLEGVYFYLKMILKNSGELEKKTLAQMESEVREIMKSSKEDFFGDVRNNHIVPSVLGFYDSPNRTLTAKGYEFAKKSFFEFCRDIVLGELGEYSRAVFISLLYLSKEASFDEAGFANISTQKIADFIKIIYQGKKVTYLFDPDGQNRNLLTMIRMMETIGAVERNANSKIKVVYPPLEGMPFLMEKYIKYPSKKIIFWFEKFGLAP
jgi:hypothetical protein